MRGRGGFPGTPPTLPRFALSAAERRKVVGVKIPWAAQLVLGIIPQDFIDDGCSNAPDSFFGFDLRWACRIHNWQYCTRCHDAGRMTQAFRTAADKELKRNIQQALPWAWRWVGWVFRLFVWRYGGISAFDSCGPEKGELCRHKVWQPEWMISLERSKSAPGPSKKE